MARPVPDKTAEALKHLSVADARLGAIIRSVGTYEIKLRKYPFQ